MVSWCFFPNFRKYPLLPPAGRVRPRRCVASKRKILVIDFRLLPFIPEEVHILQDLAAAHEDGCEILNHVGIGKLCVYPLDSQCLVDQIRLTGRTKLVDDKKIHRSC